MKDKPAVRLVLERFWWSFPHAWVRFRYGWNGGFRCGIGVVLIGLAICHFETFQAVTYYSGWVGGVALFSLGMMSLAGVLGFPPRLDWWDPECDPSAARRALLSELRRAERDTTAASVLALKLAFVITPAGLGRISYSHAVSGAFGNLDPEDEPESRAAREIVCSQLRALGARHLNITLHYLSGGHRFSWEGQSPLED